MKKKRNLFFSRILSLLLTMCLLIQGYVPAVAQASQGASADGMAQEVKTEDQGRGFIFSIEDYSSGTGKYILEPVRITNFSNERAAQTDVMLNRALEAAGIHDIKAVNGPQLDWWIDYIGSIGTLSTDNSSFDSGSGDLTSNTRWEVSFGNIFGTDIYVGKNFKYDAAHEGTVVRAMYTVNNGADIGAADRSSHLLAVNKDDLVRAIADAKACNVPELADAIKAAEQTALDTTADQGTVDAAVQTLKNVMPAPEVQVSKVSITGENSRNVLAGEQIQFEAVIEPAEASAKVQWSVDHPELADITAEGLFTARKGGEVTVTAKAGDVSASVKVKIRVPAQKVEILYEGAPSTQIDITKNQTVQLTAALDPADTTDLAAWTSENENIAKVDASGKVTGIAAGSTNITVTAGEQTAQLKVTVSEIAAEGITLSQSSVSVQESKNVTVTASVTPEGCTDPVVWTSEDPKIAVVDNGVITGVAVGNTKVTAAVGKFSATVNVEVVQGPYVYFEYSDGRPAQQMDKETNSFTLSTIDEGKFILANVEGSPEFDASVDVTDPNGDMGTEYIIKNDGTFDPYGLGDVEAAAIYPDSSDVKIFTIHVVSSGISQLRAKVDGQIATIDEPFAVLGTSKAQITVEGRKNENEEFVPVPHQAVSYLSDSGLAASVDQKGVLTVKGGTTITAVLQENYDIRTQFKTHVGAVAVESMEVKLPEYFEIDAWNALGGYYVGCQPHSGYQIIFHPGNVTNKEVTWEALTPEIAYHMKEFDNGIIPLRAGIAKFKVTSTDNPDIFQEVSMEFRYKYPVQSVTGKDRYELSVGQMTDIDLHFTPENASEQRFDWSFDKEGIVKIEENVKTDASGTGGKWFEHKMLGLKDGTVKVTGTPVDTTKNCAPIEFTVKVGKGDPEGPAVIDVTDALKHGLDNLEKESKNQYEDEWTIMTLIRGGRTISEADKAAYIESAKAKVEKGKGLKHSDYARIVFTLTAMGEDPETVLGVNVIEKMCEKGFKYTTSNMPIWVLIALDTYNYEIPASSTFTRDDIIKEILSYQAADGGFDLTDKGKEKAAGIDITAMALQALARYTDRADVKTAFDKGLDFLRNKETFNAGFVAEGGENACTSAQVVTALAAAGIDPLDSANGFVLAGNDVVSRMIKFRKDGGFGLLDGSQADLMTTQQVTYALEAYRRFTAKENSLYDMTDVVIKGQSEDSRAARRVEEQIAALKVETLEDKAAVEAARQAYEALTSEQKKLVKNVDALTAAETKLADLAAKDEWILSGNKWWYRHKDGSCTKNNWELIQGKWYFFDKDGWMLTGWINNKGSWFYADGSGAMLTNWQLIGGTWYYFNESGVMLMGWQLIGGTWYYFNGSGAMVTGWAVVNGSWYYFNGSGAMVTGWAVVNGSWYYFNGSGAMVTGWAVVNGSWYYFNGSGAMVTGWAVVNGSWYYFNGSGAMVTGWMLEGSTWYYFNGSGAMVTGWAVVNGSWYYFNGSGAMVTGWQVIGGSWYYFNGSGVMAANQWIGNCWVNASGAWV